ncbi:hypothetical protein Tco_0713289, partial [Tanacetum coccineum]
MLPVTQIETFYNGLTLRHHDTINAVAGGTFMTRRPEECYDLIENMTTHHNDWDTSAQRSKSSSSITSSNLEIASLKLEMAEINKNLMKMLQTNQQVNSVTPSCETCGGPDSYINCPATVGQTQNVYNAGAYNQGGNTYQPQGNRNLLSYRSDNYLGPPGFNVNQNQNRNNQNQNQNRNQGNNQGRNQFFQGANHVQNITSAYQAPPYQAPIPQPQVVTNAEFSNYMKANDAILKNMQTNMTTLTNSTNDLKNMLGQFMKMNTASTSVSGTLPSNTITNPREDLKGITTRRGVAYKGPTIPTTSSSPPKVVERETEVTKDTVPPTNNGGTEDVQSLVVQVETQVPNSEPVVALVVEPVEAPVSPPKPNPKPSIPYPSRLNDQSSAKKITIKWRNFTKSFKICISTLASRMLSFSCLIVDFDADPRVPLILGRSFLKTGRALIDVYARELTLRVGNKAYSQEVLGFSVSGNPTPTSDLIVSTSSPTLTPFGDSDFLLEETDAFLAIEDEPISPEINDSYYDSEGDILLLEKFLNNDPSSPPLPPQELRVGTDKLPVIIAKDLKDKEKAALIKVLKSHKQAIAWKLSDI